MALKKLPIGVEEFSDFYWDNYYYVDKTGFIIELLEQCGKVNLFTRPRRFGKTLTMSMLQSFFEIGCKPELFEGMKIDRERELRDKYMGKFPVISITLKSVDGMTFQEAKEAYKNVIGNEALRFPFLKNDEKLSEDDRKKYMALTDSENGSFTMSDNVLTRGLLTLSELLEKYYDKKVIVLIDEYDVPLDKAYQAGYYDQMVSLIRNSLGNVLKTNSKLHFAVLTGCLRISRESIFTGLNNLNVMSVTDEYFSDAFGFTEQEVRELLTYYGCEKALDTVREWYDGYRFGSENIYCPWDVIKYCQALIKNKQAFPQNYWANTSGNALVRSFVDKATLQTRQEIETLISGESVTKTIHQELTYSELETSIDNLWSVLFTTGYLTYSRQVDGDRYELKIPNREMQKLFVDQINQWFSDTVKEDAPRLSAFCDAFPSGDAEKIENLFNDYLWNTISVRDTAVAKERKENFYHGILLGLLRHRENWMVSSNAESGEGYSDILVGVPESRTGIVIEVKYAEGDKLEEACKEALDQIEEKHYDATLLAGGMKTIVKYGIACYRKHCRVVKG
jgi:hypothetical protein